MIRTVETTSSCILLLGLCALLVPNNVSGKQADRCLEMRTQDEMNTCEAERYQKADTDLNQTYRKLFVKYASDKPFVQKLRLAQQAWLKFRDAYLDSTFYQRDKLQAYG